MNLGRSGPRICAFHHSTILEIFLSMFLLKLHVFQSTVPKEQKKSKWIKQKTNCKMSDLNQNMPVITLSVKGLNTPIKR